MKMRALRLRHLPALRPPSSPSHLLPPLPSPNHGKCKSYAVFSISSSTSAFCSFSFIHYTCVLHRVDTSVKTTVEVAVNEPVAPKVEEEETAPEPAEDDPSPVSVVVKDPFEGMTPGCTKVATPLPVLLPEFVQAVHAEPEPEDSDFSGQVNVTLVEIAPNPSVTYSRTPCPGFTCATFTCPTFTCPSVCCNGDHSEH